MAAALSAAASTETSVINVLPPNTQNWVFPVSRNDGMGGLRPAKPGVMCMGGLGRHRILLPSFPPPAVAPSLSWNALPLPWLGVAGVGGGREAGQEKSHPVPQDVGSGPSAPSAMCLLRSPGSGRTHCPQDLAPRNTGSDGPGPSPRQLEEATWRNGQVRVRAAPLRWNATSAADQGRAWGSYLTPRSQTSSSSKGGKIAFIPSEQRWE